MSVWAYLVCVCVCVISNNRSLCLVSPPRRTSRCSSVLLAVFASGKWKQHLEAWGDTGKSLSCCLQPTLSELGHRKKVVISATPHPHPPYLFPPRPSLFVCLLLCSSLPLSCSDAAGAFILRDDSKKHWKKSGSSRLVVAQEWWDRPSRPIKNKEVTTFRPLVWKGLEGQKAL